jgi:hypothetical protein
MSICKILFVLVGSFLFIGFYTQDNDLNLGFENPLHNSKRRPMMGWYAGGGGKFETDIDGYYGARDSAIVRSGKYSLHLKYRKGDGFGVGTTSLEVDQVRGKLIRYSGWIKTKDVGIYAGLWLRVDGPNDKVLAFNNMIDSSINGTRDWQRFSYEIPVDKTATDVFFGVITKGKGEAWFDGLTIDTNGVRYKGED